jgi:hypothetical protein
MYVPVNERRSEMQRERTKEKLSAEKGEEKWGNELNSKRHEGAACNRISGVITPRPPHPPSSLPPQYSSHFL